MKNVAAEILEMAWSEGVFGLPKNNRPTEEIAGEKLHAAEVSCERTDGSWHIVVTAVRK